MNEQIPAEPVNTSDVIETTDQDANSPSENSDPVAYIIPVNATLIHETPIGGTVETMDKTVPPEIPHGTNTGSSSAFNNRAESEHFHLLWNEIQGRFVDDPSSAVQQADTLVSEVIEKITQMYANEHNSLKSEWNHGSDVTTEDLRKALQHYRSFFNSIVV